MWYSKLNFTTNEKGGGGFEIGHNSNRLTFSNFAMTSALTSRYDHLKRKKHNTKPLREASVKIQESTICGLNTSNVELGLATMIRK